MCDTGGNHAESGGDNVIPGDLVCPPVTDLQDSVGDMCDPGKFVCDSGD